MMVWKATLEAWCAYTPGVFEPLWCSTGRGPRSAGGYAYRLDKESGVCTHVLNPVCEIRCDARVSRMIGISGMQDCLLPPGDDVG